MPRELVKFLAIVIVIVTVLVIYHLNTDSPFNSSIFFD